MIHRFLTDAARKALTDAVEDVEAQSSAEVVVAVRPSSGSYLHADLLAGIAAAVACLVGLLFSPWPFGLVWFVVDPVLLGARVGFLVSRLPAVRRGLTRPGVRRRRVLEAARATFVEKRVHATSGRTGLLVYISLLEREAVVLHDVGIDILATSDGWQRACEDLAESVRRGDDGVAVAARVRALGDRLAPAFARSADDVDELANEVDR